MAKTMAVLDNGTVVNMIWCPDSQGDTDTLKSPGDRPVGIGDSYAEGRFYRSGAEILTPLEQARVELAALQQQLTELDAAYQEGVDSL